MTKTQSILTHLMGFEVTFTTKDVVTHSICTGKMSKDLEYMMNQSLKHFHELLRNYEKVHEEELKKVGKE